MRFALAIAFLAVALRPAHADQVDEEQAKQLYEQARSAFERKNFQLALDLFQAGYLLVPRAELLFNMASALEELERPHDAAEKLRAYLRVVPDDSDRNSIERRIRALEEKQAILDELERESRAARKVIHPPPRVGESPPPLTPPALTPPVLTPPVLKAPVRSPSAPGANLRPAAIAVGAVSVAVFIVGSALVGSVSADFPARQTYCRNLGRPCGAGDWSDLETRANAGYALWAVAGVAAAADVILWVLDLRARRSRTARGSAPRLALEVSF